MFTRARICHDPQFKALPWRRAWENSPRGTAFEVAGHELGELGTLGALDGEIALELGYSGVALG